MKAAGGYTLAAVTVDARSSVPLHQQLYDAVRGAILSRQLRAGTRLPSTRSLGSDLGVSRNTVMAAFDQLIAEGYLEGRTGSGTYVASTIPDEVLSLRNRADRKPYTSSPPDVSRRARSMSQPIIISQGKRRPFVPGLPALDLFPTRIWARLVAKQWEKTAASPFDSLTYGETAGYKPLREAVAEYLGAARGVRCDAGQVIITSGVQHGLEIATRVLLDAGDAVWFEDPGFGAARATLTAAGARVIFVPVDEGGLDVAQAEQRCRSPKLIYATPSHQFPLGVTMDVARRLHLLEIARRENAWILEDDYDSEYRHTTRPVPSIQGLDTQHRVIYLGTFSKVLFPALRLGYIVVPPALVDAFVRARTLLGRTSPTIDQAVVAQFIEEGHFERHIRRMRAVYRERQEALLDAAARHLSGLLTIRAPEAGMHTIAWLQDIDDDAAAHAAAEENIEVVPVSSLCAETTLPDALLLGYGAITPRQIRAGAETLAGVLERVRKLSSRASVH